MGSYYRGGGCSAWHPGSNSSWIFFSSNKTKKKKKGERNKRKDDEKLVNIDSVPLRNVCYGSDPTRLTHLIFYANLCLSFILILTRGNCKHTKRQR